MQHASSGFDSIVFDLDGTLWDTCASCAVAWNAVASRNRMAFRSITAQDVRQVTGKPHEVCIRETFAGLSEQQVQCLIAQTMIEDNLVIEREGGDIYPQVLEGVRELSRRYRLFIVSNCQSGYVELFLRYSGLTECFQDFECWGNTGQPKDRNLADLIRRNSLRAPVMVGDTEGDLAAARRCGIPFMHVSYGFGDVTFRDHSFGAFDELVAFFRA